MLWPLQYHLPSVVLVLGLILGFVGCNGDSNDDDIDQATLQEVETILSAVINETTEAVNAVEAQLFPAPVRQQVTTRQEPVNLPVVCLEGGQLRVVGQVLTEDTGFTLDATESFTNCDGLNGTIAVTAEVTREVTDDGVETAYTATLNGTVINACTLAFNQTVVAASRSALTGDTVGTIDGAITATCESTSFTCLLDALVFPQDPATVRVILADSCLRH